MEVPESGKQTTTEVDSSAGDAPVNIEAALESAYKETFEEPAVDQGGDKGKEPPAATPPAESVLDWSKFDLDKAPQDVREQLYRRFQPRLQERIDGLQREKEAIYERAIAALEGKGQQVAPDLKAQIKEAADAGDINRVAELQGLQFREEIDSVKSEMIRRSQLEAAVSADPTIIENQAEIANRLRSNPVLGDLVKIDGGKHTAMVLQGLNAVIKSEVLTNKLRVLETNFKAAVEKAVKEDRANRTATAKRLGISGSSAGTTQVPQREGSGKMNLNQSLDAAWEEIFGAG